MRNIGIVLLGGLAFYSCKKWTDPPPTTDPRLNNPYCNDPIAVNYNWGFPGIPDNSICYYPTDIFRGNWLYTDSVYQQSSGLFLYTREETLRVYALSKTTLAIQGFCADSLKMTATGYLANVDTIVGDTLTNRGQLWCRLQDTVNGTVSYSRIDSMLHVSLTVISDTGITNHIGKARKL